MLDYRANTVLLTRSYKVVGTRPVRPDGTDKVTGRAKYGADVQIAGLLYGKVLRSPHAHAWIKRIDTSKAEALPGVKAVVTNLDLPDVPAGPVSYGESYQLVPHTFMYEKYLAKDKVVYKGHPVAAVAATSIHIAEEALGLIEVEYEVLPPIMDPLEAMKDGAPLLHDTVTTREMGNDTGKKSNVAAHQQVIIGDSEKGFKEADIVIEREFRTSPVHPGYIEPQNATALWDADGHISMWSSNQGAFTVRQQVANFFSVPVSRITVMPVEIGGGFGGKVTVYLEPLAALLSRKAGHHPVKMVMTRQEVLETTGPTSGSFMRVKMGATKDGRITAVQAFLAYEAGAYPGSPMGGAVRTMFAPYRLDNVHIDAYDVLVNKPRVGPYRAPGVTNASFAVETIVDEICEKIGMDPIAFHEKNGIKVGDRKSDGTPM
ncbi:MAG: xanthine dehydrogenase family protein molybdopterin-binding subunit, partial [Dehalococcoidia bacterium]|nr:xanthine dehydrogenase family protein molybdopterin-binding subunit [Dehalococcoidia bacterium]